MATSGSSNFVVTRDDIITRALRQVGAIGQLETPDAGAVTEAALALNMLIKEWQGDGMQLWKIKTSSFTVTNGVGTYTIGTSGATLAQEAPLKILYAWNRNIANPAIPLDTPMLVFTKDEYDRYSSKSTPGTPSILFYKTPGPSIGDMVGSISIVPVPQPFDVANTNIFFTGVYPLQDFDASTDNPDLPSYYYNALVWGLADQLSTEYGVPLAERGFIQNKADKHLEKAKDFDIEEGSLYLQPQNEWSVG